MSRLALMIDLERCIGCKSCEAACKQEHGLGPGEFRNKVVWLSGPGRKAFNFLPITCQQCERPACLRACTVTPKAIAKDEDTGVVRVIEDRCTGCGECVAACPYGAIGYDATGHHALKCDLCADRRADGRPPACSEVCPGYAIDFGTRDDLVAQAGREDRQIRDHDNYLLGPATIYLEHMARNGEGQAGTAVQADPRQEEVPAAMGKSAGKGTGKGAGSTFARGNGSAAALTARAAQFPYRVKREHREADRVVPGGCNICFNCCTVNFHFRGDKLVNITGNPEDPLLKGKVCPKSQMTLQLYNNESRLTTPLKRVGERGEGKFEPISWDQALEEIAERMEVSRLEWGAESLGLFVGTRTGIMATLGFARMFAELWGTPNVVGTDPFCASGKSIAYEVTQGQVGSGNSYTAGDMGSAELYVYIGDNQAETRPVYFGMINDWRLRNKAKMVVVDPRRSVTASKADQWLAIRPGTDMALGLALAHHILSHGLHDRIFCESWVLGWEQWRDYILEQGYSPLWAQDITDIPAKDIEQLAEDIAGADGCVIFASRGVNQHTNSVQTNRALMFVAAITGNWGRPGGAFFNMTAGIHGSAAVPEHRKGNPTKPKVRHSASGWTEAMARGKPYPIKTLIACNNPLSNWPGQQAAREAFNALELLVHIDLFSNETSAYADYVLPAATGIEQGDVGRANDDRRVVWIDKMIEPPGQAKPDAWIWVELGKRFGFDDVLKPEHADPAVFWDDVFIQNDHLRGCTQKRLHSVPHRWVRVPVSSEDAPEQDTLFLEGATAIGAPPGHRFPTPSGKLEFWTIALEAKFHALGMSAMPRFYSEREQLINLPYVELELGDDREGVTSPFFADPTWASPARIVDGKSGTPGEELRNMGFDTELVTGRPPAPHFHSWTHYFWQAQEMWPDLHMHIHPVHAERLNIRDGDRVRVVSAHGGIDALAWLNAGIRETAVFIPMGWGERQPFNPWRSVNFLTDKTQRDPISDQTNLKTLLCRVMKL